MPTTKQLQRVRVTIDGTASGFGDLQVPASGDFVYFESITLGSTSGPLGAITNPFAILVTPDSGPAVPVTEAGKLVRFPAPFTVLRLRAPGTASVKINVTLAFGFGSFIDAIPASRTQIFAANGTVTRPANTTAYAASQVIGPQPDGPDLGIRFANVFRIGSSYSKLTRARLIKSTTTTTNASFRLHLFSPVANPPGGADQAAFAVLYAQAAQRLGVIDFSSFITGGTGSDAAFCEIDGLAITLYAPPGGYTDVWGILECLAAYAPGSAETLRVDLFGEQL